MQEAKGGLGWLIGLKVLRELVVGCENVHTE